MSHVEVVPVIPALAIHIRNIIYKRVEWPDLCSHRDTFYRIICVFRNEYILCYFPQRFLLNYAVLCCAVTVVIDTRMYYFVGEVNRFFVDVPK